ncbi:MAG: flagellar export chaperone FliS [Gammaproteobacteria bacterium]|nr:MAG: flagellar export chaperone FliS [Gammaproteobacteria bacterium]
MKQANNVAALQEYQQVGTQGSVNYASPYKLVQMLMGGVLDRIASAKGHMKRKEIAEKATSISKAIGMIEGLRVSLDMDLGGKVAQNLDGLYEYMIRRLVESNTNNNVLILDEVMGLLAEIKQGWDDIPDEVIISAEKHRRALSKPVVG